MTTDTVDRPTEDGALESWYLATHPFKRPESRQQTTERLQGQLVDAHHLPLKEIHASGNLVLEQLNMALPNKEPIIVPMLLPVNVALGHRKLVAEYEPLPDSRPRDRKRSWKDGKLVTDVWR